MTFDELFEQEIKGTKQTEQPSVASSFDDLFNQEVLGQVAKKETVKETTSVLPKKETVSPYSNIQSAPYGQNYSIDKTKVPEVKTEEIVKKPTALGGFIEKTVEAAKTGISKATERVQPKLNENPLLGPVSKEINKVVEKSYTAGIKGATETMQDSLQRVGDFTDIAQTNAPTAQKVGAGISATLGIANTLFIPITSALAAAEQVPVVGEYPVKGVNFVFGKVGEAGTFVGTSLVNTLPISDEAKEALIQPIGELTGLIAMIGVGGALHVGGKKVGEVIKTKIAEGKPLSPEWKAKLAKYAETESDVTQTMGDVKAKIVEKTADRQAQGIEITPAEGLKIVNETVKEVPIESKTPEILKVRTPEESVEVVTTKRAVFDNLIKNQEDIDYKVVKDLGTTPSGAKIGARYEFDYKTGKSTILTTKATTGANLAQEIGHYVDHKLSTDINNRFSDIIPNYKANRAEVERTLSGYALEKLNGTATSKQISKEVKRLVDSFNSDIEKLAVKEPRTQKSEKFASAVREVLLSPGKSSRIAPEFTAFIKYFNEKKGIVANVIKETYKTQKKVAEDTLLEEYLKNKSLKFRTEPKVEKKVEEPNKKPEKEKFRVKEDLEKAGIKITDAQEKEIIKLNKKIFGDENIKITEQILTPEGQTALGSYKNTFIKILDGQGNAKDTFYHEAVHKYFDLFTTSKEQGALLKDAKEKFGTKDYAETEEILAEKFIQYAKGKEVKGITDVIKNTFDSVISRVKKLLGNEDKIKALYDDILAGKAKKISETGLKTGKFVETKAFNPEKINAPQDIQNVFEGISKVSDQFKEQRISKSNEDIKALASEVGVTVEDLLKTKPGSIANAETIYKARQLVSDLAQDLRDTTRELTTETASPAQIKEFKIKLLRLQGAMKAVAGFRTEASHIFRQFQLESKAGEFDIMKDMISELKKVDAKAADDLNAFTKGAKELVEPTLADKAWHIWYMNILSGETTQIKNALGNLTQMVSEVAVEATTNPKGLPNAVSGLFQGLVTGAKLGTKILKEGDISKFEERGQKPIKFTLGYEKSQGLTRGIKKTGANILNAFDYVGRFMSATDSLFREGFRGMELRSLAREQAIKEGYSGEALKERIDNIVSDPMEKIIEEADQFAQRGTYTQKPTGILGVIASGISGITTKVPILKFVVPFTRIVANVTNNSLDWTPVGFKRALFQGKEKMTPKQTAKAYARATLGTVAMTYFASMAANDNLSGNGPSDSTKRNQLIDSGWRANSIKFGDTWYPYSNWGNMSIPMALVGNFYDSVKYGKMDEKSAMERVTAGVLGSANSILSMSFLSGVSDLLSALTNLDQGGEKYFERFIATQASSTVPNLYKQTAKYFDTTTYETTDIRTMILSNLRITSGLKPKLNVFGEPVKGDLLTQLSPSEITKDPIKRYLAENELWISVPSKATVIKTQKDPNGRKMTEDEYYNYVKYSGIEIKKRLNTQLSTLKQVPEEKKQDYVNSIVDSVRKGVKGGIQMGLYK